jgi:hypothetical protein
VVKRVVIEIARRELALFSRESLMKSTDKRLTAAAFALVAAIASAPAVADPMTSGEIERMLSGVTLDGIYFDGNYFTETYHDDGTIRYWDAVSADSGEWAVQDGQFCTFYEGQEGACFTVERSGANCFTFYEKDAKTGMIDPKKWTSRGWNRAHDNTCPEAPAAKL